jgi:hypothetical protein
MKEEENRNRERYRLRLSKKYTRGTDRNKTKEAENRTVHGREK